MPVTRFPRNDRSNALRAGGHGSWILQELCRVAFSDSQNLPSRWFGVTALRPELRNWLAQHAIKLDFLTDWDHFRTRANQKVLTSCRHLGLGGSVNTTPLLRTRPQK